MANFIPEDKISEIKNAADIVDVVSEAVLLKKAGKNHVGLCPFHSEKTPSFTVSPDKQIFHCFGCGTGGNVFSFLMKQEGLSFPETVERLARRYGVDIQFKPLSQKQKKKRSERENLLNVNRRAAEYFHQALVRSQAGQRARAYLEHRGISSETVNDFKLGFAFDGWDRLLNYFLEKQVSPSLLAKSGLILPKKNKSGFYDRFRNRIMFPIFDANKQVLGFGGRVLDDALPKYLNTPESPVYLKRRSLYGIHRAKEKSRAAGTIFIVEGYLDLLALHQHGIENAVATLGTALTSDHVRLLTRYAGKMILVYDSDEAGIRSARRCVEIFWKEHVDFRRQDVFSEDKADTHILVLPAGNDPDSYIFEHGPEAFMEAASKAPGIITFLIECAISKHGLTTEGKIRILADLQESLAAINDRVAQALYIQQLAERVGIAEAAVLERIQEISIKGSKSSTAGVGMSASNYDSRGLGPTKSDLETKGDTSVEVGNRFERQIIAMMLQFPEILPEIKKYNVLKYFENNKLKTIGQKILEFKASSASQVSELLSHIENREIQTLITSLAMENESWTKKGCHRLLVKFAENGQKVRDSSLIDEQIKAAEKSNDHALLLNLLNQKQKMAERGEKQKMAILNQ